jgi:hypothetical protein
VTVLVAVGLLAADVAAPPAVAAPRNPGLEELWEQFPLDAERDPPAARERSSDGAGAKAGPPPRVRPKAVPQPGGADATFVTWAWLALIAAAIAVLVGGARVAVMYGGHAPRPPRVQVRAHPFVRPRQLRRAAAVAASGGVRSARAALPRLRPRAPVIPATDPPPTARHGVDDLARLMNAVPRRRKPEEATMLRTRDQPDPASDIGAMKAKPQVADEAKHSTAGPQAEAEAEALKRKPRADATDTLKAKGEGEGALEKERLAAGDAIALKEKLAAAGEQKQAATPREHVSLARPRTRDTRGRSVVRPVPDAEFVAVVTEARDAEGIAERRHECEVRWWRGYLKSQFTAVATKADGAEATVASSPYFRWHKSVPPQESPSAAAALRALVETLEREGWTVAGRGEEWFAFRFRTELSADHAGPPAVHESGT